MERITEAAVAEIMQNALRSVRMRFFSAKVGKVGFRVSRCTVI